MLVFHETRANGAALHRFVGFGGVLPIAHPLPDCRCTNMPCTRLRRTQDPSLAVLQRHLAHPGKEMGANGRSLTPLPTFY